MFPSPTFQSGIPGSDPALTPYFSSLFFMPTPHPRKPLDANQTLHPGSADLQTAIATLCSLRLLVRVGSADALDGGARYRVAVGWEVVRNIGRSVGVEVEEWVGE
jgi:hypothetical protein